MSVTVKEKLAILDAAEAKGLTISSYLRSRFFPKEWIVDNTAPKPDPLVRKLVVRTFEEEDE